MLKGKALNKDSTIGIIAPASPEKFNTLKSNIKLFESTCYHNIKFGKHTFSNSYSPSYLCGTDKERAEDINDMFQDESIDAIVCLRGGYGCLRTLKYIDDSIVKSNPKFFCGFSDITLLLDHFRNLGLIGFHGPMINSTLSDVDTINSFLDVSRYNSANYEYKLCMFNGLTYVNDRSFEGELIGGNLATICSAIKTPYEVKSKDSIIFLEEVNEEPYIIDRMLTQLMLIHFFDSCKGIIVGHVNKSKFYSLQYKKDLQKTFIRRLKHLNIPMIVGFPSGHDYPNLTLPIGAHLKYNNNSNIITVTEPFLN